MNRRQFLHIVPMAGATAGICVNIMAQPREKPTTLEPGQVWREDHSGWMIVVTASPKDAFDLPLVVFVDNEGLVGLQRIFPSIIVNKYTYLGTLAELTKGKP